MRRSYYSMDTNGSEANINIYGDITSWPWKEGDTSVANLSQKLDEIGEVSRINVFINSYGGEVAEGVAIYNALKRHKAKVVTYCDGFAASIASVIFMAGDERVMNEASALMVHNAWTWVEGNADQLRKQADDLDKITQLSIAAYKAHSNLTEEEIKALLDAESWVLPEEALGYGFATRIEKTETKNASQNARMGLIAFIKAMAKQTEEENPEDEPDPEDPEENPVEDPEEDPEPEAEPDEHPEDPEDPEEKPEENNAAQLWTGLFEKLKNI